MTVVKIGVTLGSPFLFLYTTIESKREKERYGIRDKFPIIKEPCGASRITAGRGSLLERFSILLHHPPLTFGLVFGGREGLGEAEREERWKKTDFVVEK